MSLAVAVIERIQHRLRFALSPSYRQIRRRIDGLADERVYRLTAAVEGGGRSRAPQNV
jgi:hypothetical protein